MSSARPDYPATLDAAWQQHTAPRADRAPTVVSAFAGCGGSSLGYSMAGYRELLAVEWDSHACQVFARNFPHVRLHQGDIAGLDPATTGIAPRDLDVLDGSPPCQGFSQAGKRKAGDMRSQLWRQYHRLLAYWQPKAFIMENVRGLAEGAMLPVLAEILAALRATEPGYLVTARVVDASLLGVPQKRQRLIIAGVRADLGIAPVHPAPATRPVTVREAWAGLDDPGQYEVPAGPKVSALAPLIEPGRRGADALKKRGGGTNYHGIRRLHWHRPAPTICYTFKRGRANGVLHPDENRFAGTRELTRLQSFPDQWDWGDESSYEKIHNRIGNSVPPLMMRAIAAAVRQHVLDCAGAEP